MTARLTWTLAPALLALIAMQDTAAAQGAQSPVCTRLETQLAAIDRAGGDSSRAEQIRRYEETAGRQQMEIDRTVAQSRRLGCESSGFFLFGRSQGPQCGELTNQIQRMRAQLDRVNMDLQRLQAGSDQSEQRRAIMMSLSQYDCGPQYRSASAAQRPRGFFESLFGPGAGPSSIMGDPVGPDGQAGSFRTVCVRTCDGYFFPISYATGPGRFPEDERTCRRMCPASEAVLYSYRNPGESIREATSAAGGQPYTALPNAFKYRTEFNAACSCRQAGQSWAEALGPDSTLERGDIVVTEQTSKQLAQPRPEPARPAGRGADGRRGATAAVAEPAPEPAPTNTGGTPNATEQPQQAEGTKRATRSVGPRFLPVR